MKSKPEKDASVRRERLFAVLAAIAIVITIFAGAFRAKADLEPHLKKALPEAASFVAEGSGVFAAYEDQAKTHLLGYVATGIGQGYGGELLMAVTVDLDGVVSDTLIVNHTETKSFLKYVLDRDFLDALRGKSYDDPFALNEDLDSVTGATYSARALADATREAGRKVASQKLGLPKAEERSPQIQFGLAEGVLLGLFALGLVARSRRFKFTKTARWTSMLIGLFVLGFICSKPLTLVIVNKTLLGIWPQWQLNLYWYLLFGGIVLLYLTIGKNPYCDWFCPFGATQECLGAIGGAKKRVPIRVHRGLRWFQRALALGAILLAVYYRNPSISSYEVFGAFFQLIGSSFIFALLWITLLASLFLRRPWCAYLCPLRPVGDYLRIIHNWMRDLWSKVSPSSTGAAAE